MSHPLPNMIESTLQKIRDIVDVNSVVGDPDSCQCNRDWSLCFCWLYRTAGNRTAQCGGEYRISCFC